LAAGLRPDPLRELKRSPNPLAAKTGKVRGKGRGEKEGKMEKEWGRWSGRKRKGRERRGKVPHR